jgi:hypothetical protein
MAEEAGPTDPRPIASEDCQLVEVIRDEDSLTIGMRRETNEPADKQLAATSVGAYNDWMTDDWCAEDACGRLLPITLIPVWDALLGRIAVRFARADRS